MSCDKPPTRSDGGGWKPGSLNSKVWLVWGHQPHCLPEDLGGWMGLHLALQSDILSQEHMAFQG